MWSADAPAKAILFGEHAVLYGAPAIAIAIDLRASISVANSNKWILNGEEFDPLMNPHLSHLISEFGTLQSPVSISIDSEIPVAAGLGSSAALSVASGLALCCLHNRNVSTELLAKAAHKAEANAQGGRASPTDTSVSALGGAVIVNSTIINSLQHRWTVELDGPDGGNHWDVHSLSIPTSLSSIPVVIGFTGKPSSTKEMVEIVAEKMKNPSYRTSMNDISKLSENAINLLLEGDPKAIGEAMTQCHSLLKNIGVSSEELDDLIEAVLPFSFGAKLTGAGGGGCIIALSDKPEECAKAIIESGGVPYVTSFAENGVKILS